MKRIILVWLVVLVSGAGTLGVGQFNTYYHFPTQNAWWCQDNETGNSNCSSNPVQDFYYNYFIRNDTVIKGLKYHTIYTQGGLTFTLCGTTWEYYCYKVGAIREDTMKHIYFNSSATKNRDTLLYDFNLNVGDTLPATYNSNPGPYKDYVKSIDSVLVGTKYRKEFIVTDVGDSSYWKCSIIEGIGSVQGLFEPIMSIYEPSFTALECFTQNDTALYPYLNNSNCILFPEAVPTIVGSKMDISVYPNPSSGIFAFEVKNENVKVKNIEVYNVLGKKVMVEIRRLADDNLIDLSLQPNGVYLYRVIAEDGSLVGEGKLIISK